VNNHQIYVTPVFSSGEGEGDFEMNEQTLKPELHHTKSSLAQAELKAFQYKTEVDQMTSYIAALETEKQQLQQVLDNTAEMTELKFQQMGEACEKKLSEQHTSSDADLSMLICQDWRGHSRRKRVVW
jgi:hypothetical protein